MPEAATSSFVELFGAPADAAAEAPGRVNLMGEHTDYHGGFVLPMITLERTRAEVRARTDGRVRVRSAEKDGGIAEYRLGDESRHGDWVDYVRGVTMALRARDVRVAGFDLRVETSLPLGAGLSSSAALTVSVLRALRDCFGLLVDDVALAQAAQAAETDLVGAPVGIMDQMVCSVGRRGHALFLDTKTLEYEHIPWLPDADLLFVDSGIRHAHATGGYGARRQESFDAAHLLGLESLRDLDAAALARAELPPVLGRRARHVVTENARVIAAVAAVRAGDAAGLGRLFAESHASMREDYEVSLPEIDAMVVAAGGHDMVLGARLTGGGFGGGIVVLTRPGAAGAVARDLSQSDTLTAGSPSALTIASGTAAPR